MQLRRVVHRLSLVLAGVIVGMLFVLLTVSIRLQGPNADGTLWFDGVEYCRVDAPCFGVPVRFIH